MGDEGEKGVKGANGTDGMRVSIKRVFPLNVEGCRDDRAKK